jgi:hypothetical protein
MLSEASYHNMTVGRIPSVEGGIQPTLLTTKGDIIVATGNATLVRQGVGSNNQVLMADSAQADGVKWANEATATLTTTGDTLYASAANTPARLAIGSTGNVLTVAGGVPTWAAPASTTPTFVGCSAGGSTTVSNGSTVYSLAMTSENFDTDGFHDNATNNTRFTIPTGKGGKYQINIRVGIDNASGVPGNHNIYARVNGTTGAWAYTSTSSILTNATSNTNTVSVGSGILTLAAGDYIEILGRSDGGYGNMTFTLLLSIAYLGA